MLSIAQDPISVIVMIFISLVAVLVAGFLILVWLDMRRQAQATRSWPKTTGHVLDSRVISFYENAHSQGNPRKYYDPLVSYEYSVNGTTYKGKRISVGARLSLHNRAKVAQKIEAYPVGATVQVFYDPQNPELAVLEHGVTGGAILLFVAVFILVFVPALLFLPLNQIGQAILHTAVR